MLVSIPVDHPEAPAKPNPVRGHYESVEMIREIPLNPSKSKSTPNLLSTQGAPKSSDARSETIDMREHTDSDDPELNPVEWIMITRSDPGGGIPRFMVERNTPASIASDAVKFLDWATSLEEVPDPAADEDKQAEVQEKVKERQASYDAAAGNGHLAGVSSLGMNQSLTGAFEPSRPGDSGIIASLTSTAGSYMPDMVKDRLGLGGSDGQDSTEPFPAYDSDSSSTSYDSAPEMTADWKTAYEGPQTPIDGLDSESSLSLAGVRADDAASDKDFKNSSDHRHYEREIKKLQARRQTLDDRMAKSRAEAEQKAADLASKEEKDAEKQRQRLEKERQKNEEKFKKELERIEEKKRKEEERVELKRKKARDKDSNARDRREKDEYRRRVELLQRENELLRRQLGDLQRENTMLVQQVGKLEEGKKLVSQVREEMDKRTPRSSSEIWGRAKDGGWEKERERASSVQSRHSRTGSGSKGADAHSHSSGKSKLSGLVASASEEHVAS